MTSLSIWSHALQYQLRHCWALSNYFFSTVMRPRQVIVPSKRWRRRLSLGESRFFIFSLILRLVASLDATVQIFLSEPYFSPIAFRSTTWTTRGRFIFFSSPFWVWVSGICPKSQLVLKKTSSKMVFHTNRKICRILRYLFLVLSPRVWYMSISYMIFAHPASCLGPGRVI